MNETSSFMLAGVIFGLTAGISPGPLLTLVITETLKHNKIEGIKIALVPLLTDIFIIGVTLFIFSQISNFDAILGIISLFGALFLAYLGLESIQTKGLEIDVQASKPRSIQKGIMVNILSPHPYLFWLTVGSPIVFKAYQHSIESALSFILAFYFFLVGSKIMAAVLVDRSRNFLKNKAYIWIMRALGIVLFIFALQFVRDGLKLLLALS